MYTKFVRKLFSRCAVNLWPLLFLLSLPGTAHSEVYLEIVVEGGGETFATATSINDDYSEDLNIGGGGKIAAGVQYIVGENDNGSISLALGFLSDSINASNGGADFSVTTFDAIYHHHLERHRFGIGTSYHIGPNYQEDIDGLNRTDIEFDDSLGLILQYGYKMKPGYFVFFPVPALTIGLRHTEMDYQAHGNSYEASSTGLFVSYSGEW